MHVFKMYYRSTKAWQWRLCYEMIAYNWLLHLRIFRNFLFVVSIMTGFSSLFFYSVNSLFFFENILFELKHLIWNTETMLLNHDFLCTVNNFVIHIYRNYYYFFANILDSNVDEKVFKTKPILNIILKNSVVFFCSEYSFSVSTIY